MWASFWRQERIKLWWHYSKRLQEWNDWFNGTVQNISYCGPEGTIEEQDRIIIIVQTFHQGQMEITCSTIKDELKNGAEAEGNFRTCESGREKIIIVIHGLTRIEQLNM